MTDLSKLINTEQIIKVNEDAAKRYKVVEEVIDLASLKQEKEALEEELKMPEPSQEELIEFGKMVHPYYRRNIEHIKKRIEEIKSILENGY